MKVIPTAIPDVLLIEPLTHGDERGFFLESFHQKDFNQATGLDVRFVQDNHSHSIKNVLRGLHYQIERPQGKLVRAVRGAVFDVAVDLRKSSQTFGRWVGVELTEHNCFQVWIPPGFAHGFWVLGASADVLYKTTDYHAPEHERCIVWNDPSIGVQWPEGIAPQLSTKDRAGQSLAAAEVFK